MAKKTAEVTCAELQEYLDAAALMESDSPEYKSLQDQIPHKRWKAMMLHGPTCDACSNRLEEIDKIKALSRQESED